MPDLTGIDFLRRNPGAVDRAIAACECDPALFKFVMRNLLQRMGARKVTLEFVHSMIRGLAVIENEYEALALEPTPAKWDGEEVMQDGEAEAEHAVRAGHRPAARRKGVVGVAAAGDCGGS